MSSMTTISIIITCYKEGLLLRDALQSVAAQTDADVELVVVNDASSCDATNRVFGEIVPGERVKVLRRSKNGGLSAARNDGFRMASGEICMPLDADDVLPVGAVEAVRQSMRGRPDVDFCFGDYIQYNTDTGERKRVDCSLLADEAGLFFPKKWVSNVILHGSSPCKRAMWERVGGYSQEFSYDCQDVDFWMRVTAQGGRGVYVNQLLYQWNRSSAGMNANVDHRRVWEVHLVNKRFHVMQETWAMICEGFVDAVLASPGDIKMRVLMRRHGLSLLPVDADLTARFVRALIKCWVPVGVTQGVLAAKQWVRRGKT